MKQTLYMTTLALSLLIATGTAQAYSTIDDNSNPGSERDLYQICNTIFNTAYQSSDELYNDRGLSDDEDDWWFEIDEGYVNITVRYAGYGQELGIEDSAGVYTPIATNIPQGQNALYATINIDDDFVFVEKLSGSGSGKGPWYSDDRTAPVVDHFVAFDVTDLFNIKNNTAVDRAWLIAFEDLPNGGDHDYNDLVAVVANVEPTLIELSSFTAKPDNGRVTLDWATASETDNAGFNIYRAESPDGEYSRVNAELIPARGSVLEGAQYSFTDTTVQNRKTYYYRLEDIDFSGRATLHGPVTAMPLWIHGLFAF